MLLEALACKIEEASKALQACIEASPTPRREIAPSLLRRDHRCSFTRNIDFRSVVLQSIAGAAGKAMRSVLLVFEKGSAVRVSGPGYLGGPEITPAARERNARAMRPGSWGELRELCGKRESKVRVTGSVRYGRHTAEIQTVGHCNWVD